MMDRQTITDAVDVAAEAVDALEVRGLPTDALVVVIATLLTVEAKLRGAPIGIVALRVAKLAETLDKVAQAATLP